MKSINFILAVAALFLVTNTGFSQSSKSNIKAVEKTDKLNSELTSENPALALSDSQKEQIIALQIERMNEVSAYRKNNSNKEEIKAKSKELNKAMATKIKNEILTDDQAKAQASYRKKMKGSGKVNKKSKNSGMSVVEGKEMNTAASKKQKVKAEKATEKLNESLSASDPSLALTADQRTQINALNINGLLERAKMETSGASKDEIKALSKTNRKAIRNILTNEQKSVIKKKK